MKEKLSNFWLSPRLQIVTLLIVLFAILGVGTAFIEETKAPLLKVEEVQCEENVLVQAPEEERMYGTVSYYGERWNGRTTANMEIYNHKLLTCASPVLPFNTIIEITNLANCKSVVVRVNDRGPYKMDMNGKALRPLQAHPVRTFDLSEESFKSIGNLKKGLLRIQYRIVG